MIIQIYKNIISTQPEHKYQTVPPIAACKMTQMQIELDG